MYAVSIDAGGTMTDAIVSGNGELITLKIDSTPHDLTVSLLDCLSEAGDRLGYSRLSDFLSDVDLIRWSSTVTSNVLGELNGAKVGIFVAEGAESSLYGAGASPAVGTLIATENIVGIKTPADPKLILKAVKGMLKRGIRRICVCLPASFPDNAEERRLKAIITEQYPDHFIGSVPVILGSEIVQTPDDRTRAHYALINAYVHPTLAASLFKCEDRLKDEASWNGPLLIGHTDGGVARVGKTRAIDTIESGPVFGLFGAASFAALYDEPRVLCLDVGGTTAKASVADNGKPVFWRAGDLFGIPTSAPIPLLRSCPVGGGSVAKLDGDIGSLRVGPVSMGASPGPACYGLGGTNATLTDAFVVLGYLDPKGFHGGRRELDVDLAAAAIDRNVADPANLPRIAAALAIRDKAIELVSALVSETADKFGQPADAMTLFACGGNGPLFAPFVAERLGIQRTYVFFALGPVFSAFGCSTSNITHTYRKGVDIDLDAPAAETTLGDALGNLRERATLDLAAEGFDPAKAQFTAEFEVLDDDDAPAWVSFDLAPAAPTDLVDRIGAEIPDGGGTRKVDLVTLQAKYTIPTLSPEDMVDEKRGGDGGDAPTTRTLWLTEQAVDAPVYDWTQLTAGQSIAGPAVVSGGNTTCIVPDGWTLTVDDQGNGLMSR